jgi:signal transduction histidine kinase
MIAGRPHLPSWITYHLANTLLLSSFVFWAQSIFIQLGQPLSRWTVGFYCLVAALIFATMYSQMDPVPRAASVRFLLGLESLFFVALAWWAGSKLSSVNLKVISMAFGFIALSLMTHALITAQGTDPSPFSQTWNGHVVGLVVLISAVVTHFAVIGMHLELSSNKRLQKKVDRLHESQYFQLQQQIAELERQSELRLAASHLAHEINQPLTATMAMTQLCMRALRQPSADVSKIHLNLDKVAGNIKRANDLLKSINTLKDHTHTEKTAALIHECVDHAISILSTNIEHSGVHVQLNLDKTPCWVQAHPLHLTQVISNLVRNAIEAMDNSPVKYLRISTQKSADTVLFKIEDNGPPLSDEQFENLVQPFNTSKTNGLGIGLTICRALLAKHGSLLNISRKQPQGLVASFELKLITNHDQLA